MCLFVTVISVSVRMAGNFQNRTAHPHLSFYLFFSFYKHQIYLSVLVICVFYVRRKTSSCVINIWTCIILNIQGLKYVKLHWYLASSYSSYSSIATISTVTVTDWIDLLYVNKNILLSYLPVSHRFTVHSLNSFLSNF